MFLPILLCVILPLLILVLFCLPVGLAIGSGAPYLTILIGPKRIPLPDGGEKKPKKEKKKNDERPLKERLPEILEIVRLLIPAARRMLSRFVRHLRIDINRLDIIWGGEDPADAAAAYGHLCSGLAQFWAWGERTRTLRKKNIRADLDFDLPAPRWDADITITITPAWVLAAVLPAAASALKILLVMRLKKRRAAKGE